MSDCGVCIAGWDGDSESDFCKIAIRKARKPHTCCECEKQIAPGEKYEHATGKSEGDMWAFNTCLVCAEISEAFSCDGRLFGGILWENMEEAYPAMTTGCFERLQTVAAKTELMRRWNEWKFGVE